MKINLNPWPALLVGLCLCLGGALLAQTPGIAVAPHSSILRQPAAVAPVLGYVVQGAEVQAIVGTPGFAHLGDRLQAPADASQTFLAPQQTYALVRHASGSVSIWDLKRNQEDAPLAALLPGWNLVAFSPHGEAAVLSSRSGGTLQIIRDLPAAPSVDTVVSKAPDGSDRLAVSDDASFVVARLQHGDLLVERNGQDWQLLATAYAADAWTFLPHSHRLALLDAGQHSIAIADLDHPLQAPRLLSAEDVSADLLSVTKEGDLLLAASSKSHSVWTVNVQTGAVQLLGGTPNANTLQTLRNGRTFLVSTTPTVSVVRLQPSTP